MGHALTVTNPDFTSCRIMRPTYLCQREALYGLDQSEYIFPKGRSVWSKHEGLDAANEIGWTKCLHIAGP